MLYINNLKYNLKQMIRKLEQQADKENWTKLYSGYADFYKVPMDTGILDTLMGLDSR